MLPRLVWVTVFIAVLFTHSVYAASKTAKGSPKAAPIERGYPVQKMMKEASPSGGDDLVQPRFPERADAVYFAVAVNGGARLWGRTLARTLLEMGPPFGNPMGPPLRPLYIDLPESGRFSSKLLMNMCDSIDGIPIAGMVVVGDSHAAKSLALAGNSMKIPVLWAKGGFASVHNSYEEISTKFQAIIQPSYREIFEAIRSIFLQVHWHSFHVLCDINTNVILSGSKGVPLRQKPLKPTILTLPVNHEHIYKKLAFISRSTRGIVLLLCNLTIARLIMSEAQRMKMLNGHFVWLWTDTSSNTEFYETVPISSSEYEPKLPDDPGVFMKSVIENDFYDNFDVRQQSHLADLVERKMEFEDFDPNLRKNRTKNMRYDRPLYSVGLARPDIEQMNSASKRKGMARDDHSVIQKLVSGARDDFGSSELSLIFDGEGYEESVETKSKRANEHLKNLNLSANVLYHHYQDFPVGLLALRSVKMKIDRHFIRSAVRLFAATWAKIEQEERGGDRGKFPPAKNKVNNFRERQKGKQRVQKRAAAVSPLKTVEAIEMSVNTGTTRSVQATSIKQLVDNAQQYSGLDDRSTGDSSSRKTVQEDVDADDADYDDAEDADDGVGPAVGTPEKHANRSTTARTSNNRVRDDSSENSTNTNVRIKRQSSLWSIKDIPLGDRSSSDRTRPKSGAPGYQGGCYGAMSRSEHYKGQNFARHLQTYTMQALSGLAVVSNFAEKSLVSHFEILNLVPMARQSKNEPTSDGRHYNTNATKWRRVGLISGRTVHLDTIVWPGGDVIVSGLAGKARTMFRVVVSLAPPFVMQSPVNQDGKCLRGLICYQIYTTGRNNLTRMFNEIEKKNRLNDLQNIEERKYEDIQKLFSIKCCYGLSMDLLQKVASEVNFDFHLYIVHDGLFGRRTFGSADPYVRQLKPVPVSDSFSPSKFDANSGRSLKRGSKLKAAHNEALLNRTQHVVVKHFVPPSATLQWNGVIGDLLSGSADMSFAPLSVSKARSEVIDFTVPFFHGGVSLLASPETATDVPLLAFLLPFSPELWIAIFTSLNVTAVAVAIYEWLSPFGLNPWGRQRSKNFSMSSALWVMWGLLCGHLVAFKAPKSWPNKFLINVWGGFSVIFIASYTANIAALIAGLLFHNEAKFYEMSMLTQRVGSPIATATEAYVQQHDKKLWEHMKKYQLHSIEEGIFRLKNRTIDLLMYDTPILDYFRGTDQSCSLQRIGESYVEGSYAIGMTKGFPLKETISALIAKYSNDGYLDILTAKWYGDLPCFRLDREIAQPKPLGVAAVAGVFLLLGVGMVLGVLILIIEHLFYKYTLPILRHQPKDTIWKSRNIMFFSQKLYRFINCVELVSPHHAAKELVHTIRQGQITSLFQKSVKRKEDEQRRRRKSKAQFFEMIQEIRRVQQEDTTDASTQDSAKNLQALQQHSHHDKSRKSSPKSKTFGFRRDGRSSSHSSSLNVRRFSTDSSIISERLGSIGRRLSHDMTNSPPDLSHHFETFGKQQQAKFDTYSGKDCKESVSVFKCDTFNGATSDCSKPDEKPPALPAKAKKRSRRSLNPDLYDKDKRRLIPISERVAHGLAPPFLESDTGGALLRDKLHEELRLKYGKKQFMQNTKEVHSETRRSARPSEMMHSAFAVQNGAPKQKQ